MESVLIFFFKKLKYKKIKNIWTKKLQTKMNLDYLLHTRVWGKRRRKRRRTRKERRAIKKKPKENSKGKTYLLFILLCLFQILQL